MNELFYLGLVRLHSYVLTLPRDLFQQITLSSYYVQDTDKFFSHMITGVHCNPQIGCEALNCTVQSRFQT